MNKFLDKKQILEVEYDFYYSDKMFLIGISLNGGRYSQVKVNGDWKKYTEVVLKGEETFSKWEDMTYIGSGVLTDIKFAHLTIEEIKKIEETIHKI